MLGPTCKSLKSSKWALGFRREMQTAIGQQLRVECKLPKELAPEIAVLLAQLNEGQPNAVVEPARGCD
jgi:hypothetical protein